MDYVAYWTDRTEVPARRLLAWLELGTSKFHAWKDRYGKANEHNGQIPRDHWLEEWEKQPSSTTTTASPGRLSPADVHDAR